MRHELGNSEYNKRRKECEDALKVMGKNSFRSVSIDDVEKISDDILKKRALHVVTENERVLKTLSALETDNLRLVGKYLYESHYSLRDNYEVSCSEIDFIISEFEKSSNVYGARIVGAGFGGSVIVLADVGFEKVMEEISKKYMIKYGIEPKVIDVETSDGVHRIE